MGQIQKELKAMLRGSVDISAKTKKASRIGVLETFENSNQCISTDQHKSAKEL